MSSKPDIRLASFAAVMFLSLQVPVNVCQNAGISGCADSKLVNSSLTLNCRYIGKGDEVAIFWYNSSNSDILALRPSSNVPKCEVFSKIDISFDPHRISYTCDAASNTYTLTINPLLKLDNNVTWSCTFLDPEPNSVKAECIIHLSETTDVTAGDNRSSRHTITTLIICILSLGILALILIVTVVLWKRKRSHCKTCSRRHREQYAGVNISLQQEHAIELECHYD